MDGIAALGQTAHHRDVTAPLPGSVPFLAADIGGTHARIGLLAPAAGHKPELLAYHKYDCAAWPGLAPILKDFIAREVPMPVEHCVLAIAGYPLDGRVINENLAWPVSLHELRAALQLSDIALINDFAAVACAVQGLGDDAGLALTATTAPREPGPRVVLGPGTGLGAAVLIPHPPQPIILATEAGQTGLAPRTALERDILAVLAEGNHHVSTETALSGPGIVHLYRALATLRRQAPVHATPSEVTEAALAGNDPLAREALDVFCALLGSFAGDLAMLYGAAGGVFLAGGVLAHLKEYLPHSAFVERFLDKGRMRAFLERVPVRLLDHGRLGVLGAAGWYLERAATT